MSQLHPTSFNIRDKQIRNASRTQSEALLSPPAHLKSKYSYGRILKWTFVFRATAFSPSGKLRSGEGDFNVIFIEDEMRCNSNVYQNDTNF